MTKAYKQFNNNYIIRHCIFWLLLVLIVANAVFYLFFINLGVSEILLKKEKLVQLKDIKEENQILEGRYLEKFKKIDLDYAYNLGYVDVKSPMFVGKTVVVAKGNF